MSFVIYDLETTGLTKGYDQIVQFGAVRTDADLNVLDQVQLHCRLLPHIVPSPRALHVNGVPIDVLTDQSRPSHYQMMVQVRAALERWSPSMFLGFNSIAFDEEILRHAFFQSLYDPYLTVKQGSARADVLNLCRMVAALRPDVLTHGIDADSRRVFKLKPLAEANGIIVPASHEALADVSTTLALCRHIKAGAPDIWSQFLRFAHKGTVAAFVRDEDAFLFSETVGNNHRARIITRIGEHPEMAIRQYCLDLSSDLDALRQMDDEALVTLCKSPGRPVVTVRTNAAPTLWALWQSTPEHLAPFDENEVLQRVSDLRDDKLLIERLCKAAHAAERVYEPSQHVEEQLYGHDFPPREDEVLMRTFHANSLADRVALPSQFKDDRYRRLATRLVYFESPELLPSGTREAIDREVGRRLSEPADAPVKWRSIAAALQELQKLMAADLSAEEHQRMVALELHLLEQRAFLSGRTMAAEISA